MENHRFFMVYEKNADPLFYLLSLSMYTVEGLKIIHCFLF